MLRTILPFKAVFCIVVALALSPTALLWGLELSRIETEDITVLYAEGLYGGAVEVLEIYPQVKEDLEKTLRQKIAFKPTVILIRDGEVLQKMTDSSSVVAFAVPERNIMVIDHSRMNVDPFTIGLTMKHELCHLLLHQMAKKGAIPRWLGEGIAQWVSAGISEMVVSEKRSRLNEAILSGKSLNMRALVEDFPRDKESLYLAYEASKSMVAYMIDRFGMEGIIRVLDHIREGEEWERAISKALLISFDELQESWHDDLKKKLTWYTYLINNLYEILFFLAALFAMIAFVRAYIRKRAYMKEPEDDESASGQGEL
jgi:hypothetical protein